MSTSDPMDAIFGASTSANPSSAPPAQPQLSPGEHAPQPGFVGEVVPNELFMGNLDKSGRHTEEELKSFFSQYGNVVKLEIKKDPMGISKGFGFLGFDSVEAIEKCLANHANNTHNGVWIDCKRADRRAPQSRKGYDKGKGKGYGGHYGGGYGSWGYPSHGMGYGFPSHGAMDPYTPWGAAYGYQPQYGAFPPAAAAGAGGYHMAVAMGGKGYDVPPGQGGGRANPY